MDLLEVIIPNPDNFYILLDNKDEIAIDGYENISINFCNRIAYRNEVKKVIRSPLITYLVKIKTEGKEKLRYLFRDVAGDAICTVHTREAKIKVGICGYTFKANITARPIISKYIISSPGSLFLNNIRIELKLENTDISLFDEAEEAYEAYTRFDLLDL